MKSLRELLRHRNVRVNVDTMKIDTDTISETMRNMVIGAVCGTAAIPKIVELKFTIICNEFCDVQELDSTIKPCAVAQSVNALLYDESYDKIPEDADLEKIPRSLEEILSRPDTVIVDSGIHVSNEEKGDSFEVAVLLQFVTGPKLSNKQITAMLVDFLYDTSEVQHSKDIQVVPAEDEDEVSD